MMAESNSIPRFSDSEIVPSEAVEDMRKMNHNWSSVPLIRCRDCKHYRGKVIVPVCALISFDEERARVQPDGFCAWAERDE